MHAAALALPTLCAVCHDWSRTRVCVDCLRRHAQPRPRCRGCALAVPAGVLRCGACLAAPPPWAQAVAAVDYAFPWHRLVTSLKFHAAIDLAAPMAALLARAVLEAGAPRPDLVLPVPLSRARLAERGMNQAWELARRAASALGLRAWAPGLLRPVDTPHLADLPRQARAASIRGAFAIAPGASAALHGRAVALVDDVMTTGATAAEATRTLLAAGTSSVQLWVFARTPAPGDE